MKWVVLAVLAGLSSACASAQAKAPAERPTLEVPAPPPRAIQPTPQPESTTPEPVDELPPSSPAPPSKSRPTPTRETPRTEAKPPETPPTTEPAPPAANPAPIPPAPQLRTPNSADGPEAARQVRDMIDSSRKALNGVNFQRLNDAQRGQYNNAKLMLMQAEEQLKSSNFDIARNLSEKANRIATELQGR
jgi:hypothetical protein